MPRSKRSWTHYLGGVIKNIPQLDDDQLSGLLERLLKGEDVVSVVVMSQLKLVFQVAASFDHYNKDELFSVVIDGVYLSIEKYMESRQRRRKEEHLVENHARAFRSFLVKWVRSYILDFICDSKPVPVPRQTLHKHKELLPSVEQYVDQGYRRCDGQTELDVREIVQLMCSHPADRMIIQLKLEGYNNAEIAKRIGYSPAFITGRQNKLEAALRQILKNA